MAPPGEDVVVVASVEGLDPAVEASMVDQLRATWLGLGYKLIEDPRFENGDEVPTFATPGDDYHLALWRPPQHTTDNHRVTVCMAGTCADRQSGRMNCVTLLKTWCAR